ncbi:solute carrier family 28 member 3-like [Actinia tenebrosa]|uniref:Sodium/nucleoside cotransporter n=1 Tax=Actinia tenebrosa TaxID=6105 RepID=A0A6P8IVJ6_ACTTE|nr:solute carrier family 28 member 3-like [Actinia tenebrosa]
MASRKSIELKNVDSARQSNEDLEGAGKPSKLDGKRPLRERLKFFITEYSFQVKAVIIANVLLIISIAAICVSGLDKALPLFIIAMVLWFFLVYMFVRDFCGERIYISCCLPVLVVVNRNWKIIRWVVLVIALALFAVWLWYDTSRNPRKLISLGGMAVFLGTSYLFSANRRKVRWRPVIWGIALQVIFAFVILRTTHGYSTFKFIGDQVTVFLDYTNQGSKFVFGEDYEKHTIAFKILPVIIFFSSVISVLYYLGIMPLMISKIAWLMQITMGTSGVESLTAAGNIFVGQTEAPLMIRPFLAHLTDSELHAVMTSGLATVAGGVLAIYISFGVQASHLITASVMSAPAALAVSKLFYPETDTPETATQDGIHVENEGEKNVIEAAAKGASTAVSLVANVGAMLITFFAYIAFFNGVLSWLGGLFGYPELSFENICSYIFVPVAFLMGVEPQDCRAVSKFLGIKVFLNELVGYVEMAPYIKNRGSPNGGPSISAHSEVIATYALCGFSNFLGLGVLLGGLGPMAPTRKRDMAKIAIRTLVAANIACFMTASIAGFLYDDSMDKTAPFGNGTLANSTSS